MWFKHFFGNTEFLNMLFSTPIFWQLNMALTGFLFEMGKINGPVAHFVTQAVKAE